MRIIKMILLLLVVSGTVMSCNSNTRSKNAEAAKADASTVVENDWVYLFDGTSTDGWRGYNKEEFPASGWIIEDGSLRCVAGARGGTLIYDKKFSNFELSFEWKISEAGNSGVFYLAQEIPGEDIYMSGPEFQILDNDKHPDAKLGKNGNRTASSLYDLITADPQTSKPVGEWNTATIKVLNGDVTYTQNGIDVVKFTLWTDEWRAMVADSKFKDWPNFVNPAKEGFIGFQDHGNDVWFKNVKIKEL